MTFELLRRDGPDFVTRGTVSPVPSTGSKRRESAIHHDTRTAGPLELRELVTRICLRVPPAWGLTDIVAVNPFLGYAEQSFLDARRDLARRLHTDILPERSFYRDAYASGAFTDEDLDVEARALATELGASVDGLDAARARRLLDADDMTDAASTAPGARTLSIAARLDVATGSSWAPLVVGEVTRFCEAWLDRGSARWALPGKDGGLFRAFRAHARVDHTMDARGLSGFRRWAQRLPTDPNDVIFRLVRSVPVAADDREDYLSRLLGEVQGWASFLRHRSWKTSPTDVGDLVDLLAIRLVYDAGLAVLGEAAAKLDALSDEVVRSHRHDDALPRFLLLRAWERGYRRRLLGELAHGRRARTTESAAPSVATERPDVQAVFCIDVRSEVLRRHLEEISGRVDTYGFAGFFGLSLAAREPCRETHLCPALLSPSHDVVVTAPDDGTTTGSRGAMAQASGALRAFRNGALASFTYVETLGFGALASLLRDTFFGGTTARDPVDHEHADVDIDSLSHEARVALASGLLTNVGLRRPYARLVLLSGHDSSTTNNPQKAALACGACGGHSGALNARVAARLVNDARVRASLNEAGFAIPADVVAVAGVHDTTTDEVRILDRHLVPASHAGDLQRLEVVLAEAGARARRERLPKLLGVAASANDPATSSRVVFERASHWAEVRPEWGLASNAAFLVARRERSRGANLGGRVFLHSYDEAMDADGAILERILTAPVVVASWINLQYYASTVDPTVFGSGTKTLHTVVGGDLGVRVGNEGDLAVGLSLQSVHDGERPRHEPLRLLVLVEATPTRIEAVLAKHEGLRALVDNGWIQVHALSRDDDTSLAYLPGRGWEAAPGSGQPKAVPSRPGAGRTSRA